MKLDYEESLPREANYFLGLNYLLNIRHGFTESPRDTAKAIAHLQEFLSQSHPADAELPMVRAELKRLGVQY